MSCAKARARYGACECGWAIRRNSPCACGKPALGMRFLGAMRSNSDGDNLNIRNGGITQWDAALGVTRGPWQFSLNVNNLLNKQSLYDCGYLPGLCYRNAERTANVSAMYRF